MVVTKKSLKMVFGIVVTILLFATTVAAVKTFHVQETDLVKLTPTAIDPDDDQIVYYYSPPLNDQGEWQTGYDDSGEYQLEIIASDGINQTVEPVNLIVDNKNQAPYLKENKIVAKETQTIDLTGLVEDPDNDPLNYQFNAPFDKDGLWVTNHDDEGKYVAMFVVSDGEFNIKNRVNLEVLRTNQVPTVVRTFSKEKYVQLSEDKVLSFFLEAKDNDNDQLKYQWFIDGELISEQKNDQYYFDYDTAGDHQLKVVVSDGSGETTHQWVIKVEDVNRAPELVLLPITVHEGEKLVLDLPDVDDDKDELAYTFEAPLDYQGEWQTGYQDSGKYDLKLTVTDGQESITKRISITVLDVNLAPVLDLPEKLEAKENELSNWNLNIYDPDNHRIEITLNGFPEDIVFDQKGKEISWTPDYNYIKRSGGFFSNILSRLNLEHYYLRKRATDVNVMACDAELCTNKTVELVVYNTNRPPVLNKLADLIITETETLRLTANAYDPDGDLIKYTYSDPVKRSGKWKTDFNDEGKYTIYFTASDGKLTDNGELQLEVLKANRFPVMDISNDDLTVNEGQQFMFKINAEDPDNDNLTLRLDNIPPGASFNDGTFLWAPYHNTVRNKTDSWWNNMISGDGYLNKKFNSEKSTVELSFVASDGEYETIHPVRITIKNVNLAPTILNTFPEQEHTVDVNKPVYFELSVEDSDQDPLSYLWTFGLGDGTVTGTNKITRVFTSPGKKKVKVVVNDGRDSIDYEWTINVVGEVILEPIEEVALEPEVSEILEIPFTVGMMVIRG